MKISEQWLRERVATKLDTDSLVARLTLAGIEAVNAGPVASPLERVVVGEITAIRAHPQADRLRVCEVNIGKPHPLTIVCGASNAAVGLKVPTAQVGAVLPNGTQIAKTAIRGVESVGMLCSATELGLAESSDGLLVLDENARPGTGIAELLALDDRQIEVELTPNRGDCLSVTGLAREVSALLATTFRPLRVSAVKPATKRRLSVTISAPELCGRYTGRLIEGINPAATTPMWIRERLRRSGLRTIHPAVDITNYVMLELGQPMHAFDADKIRGKIVVRRAQESETLATLDEKLLELTQDDLVIADSESPMALAGVMGGSATAVGSNSQNVFLESAWFVPSAIGVRARHHGIQSDSSHRFERGVDPSIAATALALASSLMVEICGGRAGPVTDVVKKNHLPKRASIAFRSARLERVLGARIPGKAVRDILIRLGMKVSPTSGGWRVTPPSWRFDIQREVDLIEEVARVHGYDRIPARRATASLAPVRCPETEMSRMRLRDILVDRDYQEAITYSFVDPVLQGRLRLSRSALPLANPISSDMAEMRTSLWTGLLQAVLHNQNRQQNRIRIFEIGKRFVTGPGGVVREEEVVAAAVAGPALPTQWGIRSRPVDLFDVKADVAAILAKSGREFRFEPAQIPTLHPGRSMRIVDQEGGETTGYLGELHPEITANIGLNNSVILFELDWASLRKMRLPEFREISRFPAVTRDIAIVVDAGIPAQKILDCVENVAKGYLTNLELFDEYRGEGIDSGRKSLALGLTFQDTSRTLTEEDVETVVGRVIDALRTGFGGQLRQ